MSQVTLEAGVTALVVIDPYNDFISEGGKVWDRLKGVAGANNCVPHLLQVLNAARKAQLRVLYALHRRYRPGDYSDDAMHAALDVNIPNDDGAMATASEVPDSMSSLVEWRL